MKIATILLCASLVLGLAACSDEPKQTVAKHATQYSKVYEGSDGHLYTRTHEVAINTDVIFYWWLFSSDTKTWVQSTPPSTSINLIGSGKAVATNQKGEPATEEVDESQVEPQNETTEDTTSSAVPQEEPTTEAPTEAPTESAPSAPSESSSDSGGGSSDGGGGGGDGGGD